MDPVGPAAPVDRGDPADRAASVDQVVRDDAAELAYSGRRLRQPSWLVQPARRQAAHSSQQHRQHQQQQHQQQLLRQVVNTATR